MRLSVANWRDLSLVIDSVEPKEWANQGECRKASGAVNQIRKAIVDYMAEFEVLQGKIADALKPFQERILAIPEDKRAEEGKPISTEANMALKPFIDAQKELNERTKEEMVETELNPEYKNFIKSNWEKHFRKLYKVKEICNAVADALGVD